MRNQSLVILFLSVLLFTACKNTSNDPAANYVNIYMNVFDDKGVPVASGAHVYLFDDPGNLDKSIAVYQGIGAIDSTMVVNGKASLAILSDVNSGKTKPYYLYITLKDDVRQLVLTNENYSTIINELPAHLNVTVDIKLTPANANIAFWTSDKNELPIIVKSGQDIYTITSGLTAAPASVNASGVALQNVRKGPHSFYAYNAEGCVWEDNITLGRGEFRPYEFTPCVKSDVVFYISSFNANTSLLPITITLNETEVIGSITQTKNNIYTCGGTTDSTLTIKKEEGAFTYVAYAANGKCSWTGSFVVNADGVCVPVKLNDCK